MDIRPVCCDITRVVVAVRQTLILRYGWMLEASCHDAWGHFEELKSPHFEQHIFENISALMRFVVSGISGTLPTFEGGVLPMDQCAEL